MASQVWIGVLAIRIANCGQLSSSRTLRTLAKSPALSSLVPLKAEAMRPLFKSYNALPKDLRTIGANKEYKSALAQLEKKSPAKTQADRLNHSKQAKIRAAGKLKHTPAMHESNYLDPKIERSYVKTVQAGRGPPF